MLQLVTVIQHCPSGWFWFGSQLCFLRAVRSGSSGNDLHQPLIGLEFSSFSFVLWILCTICLLPLTSSGSQFESDTESTLLFVFTLSRHGDRAPIHRPVHDPYESLWSNGYGQLTSLGVQQLVELGRYIRQKYATVLPANYHKDSFFFRSTGTSRTIQSGTSFIRGLFSMTEDQSNPPLAAAPPLFSMPVKDDRLLKMSSFCPQAKQLVDALFDGPEARDKVRQYDHTIRVLQILYPYLFPAQRKSPSRLLLGSWKACDPVTNWVEHNVPDRPSWLTPRLYADCAHLLDWKQYIRFSRTDLTRLHGGPLVAHILRVLRARANAQLRATGRESLRPELPAPHGREMLSNTTAKHSLVSYFAHDSTLAAVLSHLGLFDRRKPPLASTIIFELHEICSDPKHCSRGTDNSDPFYVRLIYRNYSWPSDERTEQALVLWPTACMPDLLAPNQPSARSSLCPLARWESTIRDTYARLEPDECAPPTNWFHDWDHLISAEKIPIHTIALLFSQIILLKFLLWTQQLMYPPERSQTSVVSEALPISDVM
ncbi:Lysosomal acid phosphatase [Fasciola hepatica]|uniref:2-phosphoxylose phosphatase 1 n=1 Tax=Fasciola hepatica TaxID=6192 RepID=A0A4E0RWY3_FASHE|nr:Lysosomal acid phosphatase [Fasciola hepatica]